MSYVTKAPKQTGMKRRLLQNSSNAATKLTIVNSISLDTYRWFNKYIGQLWQVSSYQSIKSNNFISGNEAHRSKTVKQTEDKKNKKKFICHEQ